VQGQAGPSWKDGADGWILTSTVVTVFGPRPEREKLILVTMAALCYFTIAQESAGRLWPVDSHSSRGRMSGHAARLSPHSV
jgi:hypothetical protein